MHQYLAALAAAAALTVAAPAAAAPAPRAPCHEDQACFVWSVDGNQKRGIATLDGARKRIVGPCAFARLHRYIDWTRTPRLRGDATARRYGCAGKAYRPIPPESIY